ncbi:hypothetical protein AB6A40_001290 [Gnathostoma spinigerum]|uniref:Pre-mRNA-splicing factor 18 n=1 Tax=Gnathostoma spinigerum TaxID=75299 RepID=A0ABD6E624_9BILA
MEVLMKELNRKRAAAESVAVVDQSGCKFIKRGDLIAKENNEYWKRYRSKHQSTSTSISNEEVASTSEVDNEEAVGDDDGTMNRADVIKALRSRGEPILLFGETEHDALLRLRKLEIEQPDLKEGWKNDFQSAMKEVDHELVEEVIKGESENKSKHDVDLPSFGDDKTWERIEADARLLNEGDNPQRDCDIIRGFFEYILTRWARALNARDEAEKRSAQGKLDSGQHKQTMEHLKPLLTSLERHNVNVDIRQHLSKICRLIIIDRDYIRANNAYMEMAIGNAPWPVGVTRSGLHQRPGSAKAYVSNIAHVLNDETQRKYIQAFKRIMTRCQKYFPADPSKCVEYVRDD